MATIDNEDSLQIVIQDLLMHSLAGTASLVLTYSNRFVEAVKVKGDDITTMLFLDFL